MSRLRLLGVLVGAFAALALSATPAFAEWESTQTNGTISILKSGHFEYPGNGLVRCPNLAEIKAQWQIQGAGQVKQQQKVTTKGPHLLVQVKEWGKCEVEAVLMKFPATVSECDFQLVQQAGVFTATGAVVQKPCVVKATINNNNCTIQVPVGMEKSQGSGTGINVGLKSVALSNVTPNQLDLANITEGGENQKGKGIYAQASGPGCLNTEPTGEATLKELEFEAENVKAV